MGVDGREDVSSNRFLGKNVNSVIALDSFMTFVGFPGQDFLI
jgi:hypothetical protein